jgi:hypothetical protein
MQNPPTLAGLAVRNARRTNVDHGTAFTRAGAVIPSVAPLAKPLWPHSH